QGQPITLQATVRATASGSSTPTGTVTFFDGSMALGRINLKADGTASGTVTLAPGSHSLYAHYDGETDPITFNTSQSATQPVNVLATIVGSLVSRKTHGHRRMYLKVLNAATGLVLRQFLSPFQPPAYHGLQVTPKDLNGDGAADLLILSARRGGNTI